MERCSGWGNGWNGIMRSVRANNFIRACAGPENEVGSLTAGSAWGEGMSSRVGKTRKLAVSQAVAMLGYES